jgi:type IV pilus assembly protein PilO
VKNQKIVVMAGIAAVIIVAWYLLLWSPNGRDLDSSRERREAAEQALDEAEAKLARLESAATRRTELAATASRMQAAVPDTADLPGLILSINGLAQTSGVQFLSIAPAAPAAGVGGQPTNVPLTLDIAGDYWTVLDFLHRLNHLDRIVTVDGLSLSPTTEGTIVQSVNVNLSARTFTTQPVAPATPLTTTGTVAPAAPAAPPAPAAPAGGGE